MSKFKLDHTHEAARLSWVESANVSDCQFPIQNLPFCRFVRTGQVCVGVGIGDFVFDLTGAAQRKLVDVPGLSVGQLTQIGAGSTELRHVIFAGLEDGGGWASHSDLLYPQDSVEFLLPFEVGDYTDFYASIHHATRVGSMFRPDNPLLPNYKHIPIAYHGRSSTVVVSGSDVHRPSGQLKGDQDALPAFGPCKLLDYELELGLWVGQSTQSGQSLSVAESAQAYLGVGLLNDWSARDIQKWEYQPLGPFLAKNFATSVSPWVITLEALAPFRLPANLRGTQDPPVLDYLLDAVDQSNGLWDIQLEVLLSSAAMRAAGTEPYQVSTSNAKELYWTPAQMLAHHSSNGCRMRAGDLLASGTISGPAIESAGCLLERTWVGPEQPRRPVQISNQETRIFLQDGDCVCIKGRCQRDGFRSLGFGQCQGTIFAGKVRH
jgi:fumarylacetoacetase